MMKCLFNLCYRFQGIAAVRDGGDALGAEQDADEGRAAEDEGPPSRCRPSFLDLKEGIM